MQWAQVLRRAYVDEQLTCAEIAKRTGVSVSSIRRWLRELGIPLRRRGPAPTRDKNIARRFTPRDVERLAQQIEALRATKLSLRQCAVKLNLGRETTRLIATGQYFNRRRGPSSSSRPAGAENLAEDKHHDQEE